VRVAIVCYFAPPLRAIASHRVLRLSRALLAAGHEVHWVAVDPTCIADPQDTLDQSLGALIPGQVLQHRMGTQALVTKPVASGLWEKVQRTLAFELPRLLSLPDGFFGWTRTLRRQLPGLLREQRIEAVVLCCSPHGQIGLVPSLRRALPALGIYVDYRDLLSGNPWNQGSTRRARRLAVWERRHLRHADAVFVNTEAARQAFLKGVGPLPETPVEVMRNCADYDLAEELAARGGGRDLGSGTHLGFFGTLFPRRRLAPVLAALARLDAAKLAGIHVHVYCDAMDSKRLLLEDLAGVPDTVAARVARHDYLPFAEALGTMRAMDALLLVNGPETADAVFVPGKLYDYLMARRPILFVGGRGDAADIVAEACGAGACFGHSETDALAGAIHALTRGRSPDQQPVARLAPAATFAPLLKRLEVG